MGRPAKVLGIFSTLLGNKAAATRLVDTLCSIKNIDPTFVLVDVEDYVRYPAPWWARATEPWIGQYIARRKAEPVIREQFDLLFMNSWEFAVAFQDVAQRMPAAVVMDAVPATLHAQLRNRGSTGWKRWLSHQVHHRAFGKAAPRIFYFLPMGSDCADSLHRDYGIAQHRCSTTLAPQDTGIWKPEFRTYSPPFRLLFAGNDFVRKGGDFLLNLYARHLAGKYTLTIASNDPALNGRALPAGVEWLQGRTREELRQVYNDSHIFLFPTRQDYMPQVLAEALAMGVPCMANDVGGIRDLIHDNETGFLMNVSDPPEAWAERLDYLAAHPDELKRMSAAARRFAEEKLDINRFTTLIEEVVDKMRQRAESFRP